MLLLFCRFLSPHHTQITDGQGNKESLSLTGAVDLGNGYLAVGGTTNGNSYIIEIGTKKAVKLAGISEDVTINW